MIIILCDFAIKAGMLLYARALFDVNKLQKFNV